jgi:hypothetical protein
MGRISTSGVPRFSILNSVLDDNALASSLVGDVEPHGGDQYGAPITTWRLALEMLSNTMLFSRLYMMTAPRMATGAHAAGQRRVADGRGGDKALSWVVQ